LFVGHRFPHSVERLPEGNTNFFEAREALNFTTILETWCGRILNVGEK
jgi:hypothetical protein